MLPFLFSVFLTFTSGSFGSGLEFVHLISTFKNIFAQLHVPKASLANPYHPTKKTEKHTSKPSTVNLVVVSNINPRLFQHTFGTHPEQAISRDSSHNWRTGGCLGCALGVCYYFLGIKSLFQIFMPILRVK